MKLIYPDYYSDFSCLAGACPDSCCKSWEIVIDPDTLAKYNAIPGELGRRIRSAMTVVDGETCFSLTDGHCPLFTPEGLCGIQLALGEDALCNTCGSHPRFFEEYGATREVTLSLSCPAAAKLLLDRQEPLRFVAEQTDEAVEDPCDLDTDLYLALLQGRSLALELVRARSRAFADRLALLLLFSARFQSLIDQRDFAKLPHLISRFDTANAQERQLLRLRRMRRKRGSFFQPWMLLRNMEHLTTEFPALLERTPRRSLPHRDFDRQYSAQLENLCVYFLFRWFCKAVNDGQLLPRVLGCVFHVVSIRQLYLASGKEGLDEFRTLCSLYSKEVEHSDDNLALLSRAVRLGTLRWQTVAALL